MKVTRRDFIRGGVAAFTVSFAAPAFLSDLARAQGASRRNLVVLYLYGGNDALTTLVPYTDPFYYSRRPTIAVPAGQRAAGRHRQLGRRARPAPAAHRTAADLRRRASRADSAHRLSELEPIALSRHRHLDHGQLRQTPTGTGWLGRYLDTLPSPVDPLAGWVTVREVPRALIGNKVSVPAIPSIARLRVPESEPPAPRRAGVRATGDDAHRVAPAAGQAASVVRQRHHAGGDRDARSRGVGRHVHRRR